MTPLDKLYCQKSAEGLFLITEPDVCVECLEAMKEAQWAATAEETDTQ